MTAGKGIIHSEMPEQEQGLLSGVQLWINLPANQKMTAPAYQEFPATHIPKESRPNNVNVKIIAGNTQQGTKGPVTAISTNPILLDVELPPGNVFIEPLPGSHNAFIYMISGAVKALAEHGDTDREIHAGELGVFGSGEQIQLFSTEAGTRFLLVAARRLNEPVARHGPFVMNHQAELVQAFKDYQQGNF